MDKLTKVYQQEMKRTRLATGDSVAQTWRRLKSYSDPDVERFVQQVTPIVRAGQQRVSATATAYAARKLNQQPIGIPLDDVVARVRDGKPMTEVYRRPFIKFWTDLRDGIPYDEAVQHGMNRAINISMMDVLLAFATTMTMFAEAYNDANSADGGDPGERIVAWQRVSDPSCCDFCTFLDGVFTGADEPMPLHNNCNCTAEPLTASMKKERRDAKDEAKALASAEQFRIESHGEYGPLIVGQAQPEDTPEA